MGTCQLTHSSICSTTTLSSTLASSSPSTVSTSYWSECTQPSTYFSNLELSDVSRYCENGSLHSILKAYGKFPENLVGVYMTQVLRGLQYLHDQGVIHRDIKGANILTTKDGTVKLADFGVSTSTLAGGQDKEAQVVGTPYWMAPEIIQLSGASSASDIWSVGCTVIELLQGRPPYHNLAAMPALFAIVNDDHPPLPEGISPVSSNLCLQLLVSWKIYADNAIGFTRFPNAVFPKRPQLASFCQETHETCLDHGEPPRRGSGVESP